jgi:hypothetical protein
MPAPPRPGRLIRCRNTQSSCTNPPVWRPCTSTWQIPPRASPGARARAWARNIHAGKASKSPKGPLPQKSRETRASLQCQATSAGTTNTPRFRQSSTALDMPGQLSGALSSVHPICKKWVAAIRLSEIFGRSPQHRDAIFRQRYPLCCLLCWLSLSLFPLLRCARPDHGCTALASGLLMVLFLRLNCFLAGGIRPPAATLTGKNRCGMGESAMGMAKTGVVEKIGNWNVQARGQLFFFIAPENVAIVNVSRARGWYL